MNSSPNHSLLRAFLLVGFISAAALLFPSFAYAQAVNAAPEAEFDERRSWGQIKFGRYLNYIDRWVAGAEVITADIGPVQKLAPVGKPNYFQNCFTDGCYAVMNLEVVGEKGTGTLYLPYVVIVNTGELQSIGRDARWTFGGKSDLVEKSGRSYLAEYGLDEKYYRLLKLAEQKQPQDTLKEFRALRGLLKRRLPKAANAAMFAGELHWHYRRPLLEVIARTYIESGNRTTAALVYRDIAQEGLSRVREHLRRDNKRRNLQEAATILTAARGALKQAHELSPTDGETKRMAKTAVGLLYLIKVNGSTWPPRADEASDAEMIAWGKGTLGFFYDEAVSYINRAPFFKKTMGHRLAIIPKENALSKVFVGKNGYYRAVVFLEVRGQGKLGSLMVRLRENPDKHEPVDLFAEEPRMPDYPVKLRSPYWTPDGGKELRLSAKTGEEYPRKKRKKDASKK